MDDQLIERYIQSIQESHHNILETVEPLSEEAIRWKPSTEEWSILQVLAHLNEATPYWLGEVERVLADPGSEWGRGLQHPRRLKAVEHPESLEVQPQIDELKKLNAQISGELAKVSEERLTEENPHRNFEKFGYKPVSFIIEHFMVEHIEQHYNQIHRNLRQMPATVK